jgi:hypothetical protein
MHCLHALSVARLPTLGYPQQYRMIQGFHISPDSVPPIEQLHALPGCAVHPLLVLCANWQSGCLAAAHFLYVAAL